MNLDVYSMEKGKMSLLQYYLTKLAEEACEVSVVALKTQQFGPMEVMSGQPLTNYDRVHLELNDLLAVVQVLNEKFDFGFVPDPKLWDKKKEKMERYLELSTTLGYVTATFCSTKKPSEQKDPDSTPKYAVTRVAPLYEHGCNNCVYLGSYLEVDLYFCFSPNWKTETFVARYSDNLMDYDAGLNDLNNKYLVEARRRATEIGLFQDN